MMEDMFGKRKKLDTAPYKGVRDFYPEDMFIQEYIFSAMKDAAERYGYEKYDASILEPTELYKAKTGEEIVNEQTYSFVDRGERDVTLRPEMTPTVARMVAARKRELPLPIRWYSIPNLFRYERPQRGRLREHYQFNVDIFGVDTYEAEVEVILVARQTLLNLGLKDENFKIRINDRRILSNYFDNVLKLSPEQSLRLQKLIDKKDKIDNFEEEAKKIAADFDMNSLIPNESLSNIMKRLQALGLNYEFDPYIVRGFDYYTGTVFEFYDTGDKNSRSICGGGRYDELLSIFGSDMLPTVGFGLGDVIARDLMETYDLLPKYDHPADIEVLPIVKGYEADVFLLAEKLRSRGIRVAINFIDRSISDKLKAASKRQVKKVLLYGDDEATSGNYTIKDLLSGASVSANLEEVIKILKK